MKQHPSVVRRCAAAVTAAALIVGASGLLAPAEAAKGKKPMKGKVAGTVALTCNVIGTDFDYDAKIKLSGTRAKKSDKTLKLKATFSDMPGVAPVPIDNDTESKLRLKVGSSKATLKGKGHATAAPSTPVSMSAVKGSVKNKKNSLAVSVTGFEMSIPDYSITITCAPTGSGGLGTLKMR